MASFSYFINHKAQFEIDATLFDDFNEALERHYGNREW